MTLDRPIILDINPRLLAGGGGDRRGGGYAALAAILLHLAEYWSDYI